ncbi:EcsC family protein [Pseudarthrobacter sp. AB1]|uniref:EcsC family protein n=1 Tax=Pseudarthrobacter sp. AB1 TaxID=2138309 RepID=UPI00186B630A|nr:EcsC family protein [Pseudarthrobacter sp. AB1]MBE4719850.1 serine/arginine repetitive matrix protein 2 [Pseudarthrobacter sp. AB1]
MTEPSAYELNAWRSIQQYKGSPATQAIQSTLGHASGYLSRANDRAVEYLESRPRTQALAVRTQELVAKTAQIAGATKQKVAEAIPAAVSAWQGTAVGSVQRAVGKVARVGLSPKRVVAKHQEAGHEIKHLFELRGLDLEQIDAVRGRGSTWGYPVGGAAVSAISSFVISGSSLATVVSAGAAAAPSGATIAGAFAADAAATYGLASRCVGEIALSYGFDPEAPGEQLFIMSVLNLATAATAGAKAAAMADISRLTQGLMRGKTWAFLLDASLIAKVSKSFADRFGRRLTQKGLGKLAPGVGIALGSVLNWATLDEIASVADVEYRRRFLLEKYPHLADQVQDVPMPDRDAVVVDGEVIEDEEISILGEVAEAGGPDLRGEETDPDEDS